jgi:UDP-glucose 4-epimerase
MTRKKISRIFVTGATGFVGAEVVRQLVSDGRDVAILMRTSSDARRIEDLLSRCNVIYGDLENIEAIRNVLTDFSPEAVIHLGWNGVKGVDRNSPEQVDNIISSINLYKLTGQIGCRYFVGLGSQAEYGPLAGRIYENAPAHPTTCYGAAKLATGLVLDRSSVAIDRPFAWLRLFSSYGPDDDPSWLIPYLIKTLLAGEKPSLTKAEQIWDYVHVKDVAAGIIASVDAEICGVFNIGSGEGRPLYDIISMIRDAVNPSLPLGFGEVAYRPDQVMHLEADITALSLATGWRPAIPLELGIADTVNWYRGTFK